MVSRDEIQSNYDDKQIFAIYDLGRTYYRMGYYAAAERLFSGLTKLYPATTPAEVGLALIKIESGFIIEGREYLKQVLDSDQLSIKIAARISMAITYLYEGDFQRSLEIIKELDKLLLNEIDVDEDLLKLAKTIFARASQLREGQGLSI